MIKTKFTHITLQIALFVSAFLCPVGEAAALNIDPFAFCTNSCKSPGLCQTEKKVAEQCKKMCSDNSIWKHVASLQMSSGSKDFRMEKDLKKKEGMLYKSPMAKCLGLTANQESAKVESPASSLLPAAIPTNKDDLCAAAIKKEMSDLEHDKAALETQNHNLGAALKALQDAPAK